METRNIYITGTDKVRLEKVVNAAAAAGEKGRGDLQGLVQELARAKVVDSTSVRPDVVTMNSRVILEDTDTGEEMDFVLAFPDEADVDKGAISVLAPIGTAILGYSEGDVVEWPVPDGIRHIRIRKIVYQPEAAGDTEL